MRDERTTTFKLELTQAEIAAACISLNIAIGVSGEWGVDAKVPSNLFTVIAKQAREQGFDLPSYFKALDLEIIKRKNQQN